jgi:hypothetical protein
VGVLSGTDDSGTGPDAGERKMSIAEENAVVELRTVKEKLDSIELVCSF